MRAALASIRGVTRSWGPGGGGARRGPRLTESHTCIERKQGGMTAALT